MEINDREGSGSRLRDASMGRKLTVVFISCVVGFGILVCLAGYWRNYHKEQKENQTYLLRCARLASEIFLQSDVEELVSDNSRRLYLQCKKEMDHIQTDMELKYVYTYIPEEDGKSYTLVMVSGKIQEDRWKPGQVMDETVPPEVMDVYEGRKESCFRISRNRYGYMASMFCPVYGSDGDIQAVTGAALERGAIVSGFFREIAWVSVLILAGCLVFFFLLRYFSFQYVIRPVTELSEHMEHFVKDREEGRSFNQIEIRSRDEIGQMTAVFNRMAGDLEYYVKKTADMAAAAEKERTEMEAARRIQKASLPEGNDPWKEDARFRLYAGMQPARQVGGDFYDYFRVSEDSLATVIGDVSGKGITAALFMMRAMTLIRGCMLEGKELSQVLEQVNNELCDRNTEGMFVTVFVGILDLETGRYRYAGAGHQPPYVCREEFEALQLDPGLPLGLFEEEEYACAEADLRQGESIFLYTDGVTEAMNEEKELWGEARMKELLNLHKDSDCEEIARAISSAVAQFAKEAKQSDDITMLVLKYSKEFI